MSELKGIGIDLGTTYSCVVHRDKDGAEVTIEDADGGSLTPSVVYFGRNSILVGVEAKRMLSEDPENVVTAIKRRMGQDFPLEFAGQIFTPESVSAVILRHLASGAASALSVPLSTLAAVATVPAYFGVAEKEATFAAAEIAGLRCLELLQEPVAAAYAYGLGTGQGSASLVFDLGGGTFDVAVVGSWQGPPKVWAVDGETHLGGLDWDERVQELLWAQLEELPEASDLRYDDKVMGAIQGTSERIKRKLSVSNSATDRLRIEGRMVTLCVSRHSFDDASSDLVVRCLDTVERVAAAATALGAPPVTQVLLVGGATRMPMIREALAVHLALPVRLTDPDKAVARGAAMLAEDIVSATNGAARWPEQAGSVQRGRVRQIQPVLPRSLGVLIHSSLEPWREGPYVHAVVSANTPLPILRLEHVVATIVDDQERARVQLFEQGGASSSANPADNRVVLDGEIVGIPPGPAGSALSLFVSVDEDGRISVDATHDRSRIRLKIEAYIHGVLDDSEVAAQRRIVDGLTFER